MNSDFDIIEVFGREIFDSEGLPAIEMEAVLENGARGRASAILSGDTDSLACQELALRINHMLGEAILFEDASNQRRIDHILMEHGGAENTWKGGVENLRGCISALSMAVSKAAAAGHMMPLYRYLGGIAPCSLPVPIVTVLSGAEADQEKKAKQQWEEIMVVPLAAQDFSEKFRCCVKVYHTLKKLLAACGHRTAIGRTGGFVLGSCSRLEAFDYVTDAMKLCGCRPGKDMALISDGEMPPDPALFSLTDAAVITMEQSVTVTRAIESLEMAKREGKCAVISHGSRETGDTFAADFAAAMRGDFLKMGAPCRMEWISKYNEMLRLEEWMRRVCH